MAPANTRATPRPRRRRGSVSADEILQGAFEVAHVASLDQLSMPMLAEHLDTGVTTLYWYFRKKEDLLNVMTDRAVDTFLARMPAPADSQSWQAMLFDYFSAQRRIYLDDEVIRDLMLLRPLSYSAETTTKVFLPVERVLASLVRAGFEGGTALSMFNTLSVYTRGIVLHGSILKRSHSPLLDDRRRRIADWSQMPTLRALVGDHSIGGIDDDDFEFGLTNLIDGFARLRSDESDV